MSARVKSDDASDDESGDIIEIDVRKGHSIFKIRHNIIGRLCMCGTFLVFATLLTFLVLCLTNVVGTTNEVRLQIAEWREDGTLSEALNASIAFLQEYNVILSNSNETITIIRETISDMSIPALNATNDLAATLQTLREHQLTSSGALPVLSATLVAGGT